MVGSGPRKPSSPAQGMEEESVSLGAQNEVACVSRGLRSMALGLSVIIRKMGTMLASKKGLSWGSNGGGMLSSTACPFPGMPCTPHWQHPRPTPCPLVGCPSPIRAQTDLSPLQHLPLVQHFHGKNLPAVPLPHHGDLRPQGDRCQLCPGANPSPHLSHALRSPPRRPLGRSPSRSRSHLSAASALLPSLRRGWLRGHRAELRDRKGRAPAPALAWGKQELRPPPPPRPGQGWPPQGAGGSLWPSC